MNQILDLSTSIAQDSSSSSPAIPTLHPVFPRYLDSSMLSAFNACERKFFLSYIHHWKGKGRNVHLHAGGAFAKGLEIARKAFYCGLVEEPIGYEPQTDPLLPPKPLWRQTQTSPGDSELSIALGLKALIATYGNFEPPPDSAKTLARMCGALEFYFERYPLEFGEGKGEPILLSTSTNQRAIEFSFAHPLPILNPSTGDPILYVGRMDAIIDFAGGNWICDEKTTTQLGASWSQQWDLRGQFTGYAWGARQAGIRVEGAMVRGISILKTKYDTLSPLTFRPDWQIARWYDELLVKIERMIGCWKDEIWLHDLDSSCAEYGGCPFRQVCSSEDPLPWLETYFERREWNPLLREEKLVI